MIEVDVLSVRAREKAETAGKRSNDEREPEYNHHDENTTKYQIKIIQLLIVDELGRHEKSTYP